MLLDSDQLFHTLDPAVAVFLGPATLWIAHFFIGCAAIFGAFFLLQFPALLSRLQTQIEEAPVSRTMVLAHVVSLAVFAACAYLLAHHGSSAILIPWLVAGIGVLYTAATAIVPLPLWIATLRATGLLPVYATAGAAVAASVVQLSERLWVPLTAITFAAVKLILSPILPAMVVRPDLAEIGSNTFTVTIASQCSGMEGAALMLVFLALWLILFRDEIRLPQALLIVPAAVLVLLILNAVRISALILIGNAGAPDVAVQGFHSQAGWLAFNSVAFAICVGARHIPWIYAGPVSTGAVGETSVVRNTPVAAYLTPFLAILLAGMVARAASGSFEWPYAIRLLAVGIPLWMFRRQYASLFRLWDWSAIAVGGGVFVLWVALDKAFTGWTVAHAMPSALAGVSPAWRTAWIVLRLITAVSVVPLAEELAFRGYAMRRLAGEDFDDIRPQDVSWLPIAISSLIFGVLHGSRWVAGTLAGLAYAWGYRQRGKLGSAVLAHACTNLLLAIYVLVSSDWSLW